MINLEAIDTGGNRRDAQIEMLSAGFPILVLMIWALGRIDCMAIYTFVDVEVCCCVLVAVQTAVEPDNREKNDH